MANLAMESFQIYNNTQIIPIFYNYSSAYVKVYFQSGGRDNLRYAEIDIESYKKVNLLNFVEPVGIYIGFRTWPHLNSRGYSGSSQHTSETLMSLGNSSGRFTIVFSKNIIRLNDEETLNYSDGSSKYIEIGMNENFFEIRIDEETKYKKENTFGNPNFIELKAYYNTEMTMMDLYINDDRGEINNGFLGNVMVNAYMITGNGSESHGFTTNYHTELYQAVNEYPATKSYYIKSKAIGDKALFTLKDIAEENTQTLSVKQVIAADKIAGTSGTLTLLANIGDSSYVSDPLSLTSDHNSSSIFYDYRIMEKAPGNQLWTRELFNQMQIGVEVVP